MNRRRGSAGSAPSHTLRRGRYHVLEAASGPEALALWDDHDGPVHLLLTDVVMPQMNSCELRDRVARRNSSIRVLFMSAYNDDAIVHHGVLEPGVDLIQKPFQPAQLLARIRELLDRTSAPGV